MSTSARKAKSRTVPAHKKPALRILSNHVQQTGDRYLVILDGKVIFQTDDPQAAIAERFKRPGAIIAGRLWTDAGGEPPLEDDLPYPPSNPVGYAISNLSEPLLDKLRKALGKLGHVQSLSNNGIAYRTGRFNEKKLRYFRTATNRECAAVECRVELMTWFNICGDLKPQVEEWLNRIVREIGEVCKQVKQIEDNRDMSLIQSFVFDSKAYTKFLQEGKKVDRDGTVESGRDGGEAGDKRDLIQRLCDIDKHVEERCDYSRMKVHCFGVVKASNVECETVSLSQAVGFAQGRNHDSIVVGLVRPVRAKKGRVE